MEFMDIHKDFRGICRACEYVNNSTISISESQMFGNMELTLCEAMSCCASVQVNIDDGLPQQICSKCVEKLRSAFLFKKRCEQTDLSLRMRFKAMKTVDDSCEFDELSGANILLLQLKSQGKMDTKNEMDTMEIKQEPEYITSDSNLEYRTQMVVKVEENKTQCDCSECNFPYDDLHSHTKHSEKTHAENCKCSENIVDGQSVQNQSNLIESEMQDIHKTEETVMDIESVLIKTETNQNEETVPTIYNECGSHASRECDKTFKLLKNLQTHIKKEECKTPESTEKLVRNPPERNHRKEKSFACDFCDYSCTHSGHLKQHMLIHRAEKPFKCTLCAFTTTLQSNLKRHTLTHSGEKPFKCSVCGCTFRLQFHLKRHTMTHTGTKPFKCNVCDYGSNFKQCLKEHMMKHNGDKPFMCDVCGYSFSRTTRWKLHMMTHSGEKPFKCNVCDYSSIRNAHLKKHMMTHSRKKDRVSKTKAKV